MKRIESNERRNRRQGFSLAELMVVIVIIGLLATAVVPKLMDRLADARWGKVKADIVAIDEALTIYATNNITFPDSLEALVTPDKNNRTYLAMDSVPVDPWGNEYGYEPPGGGEPNPRVICFGADGAPGGEGDDRDVTNTDIRNNRF